MCFFIQRGATTQKQSTLEYQLMLGAQVYLEWVTITPKRHSVCIHELPILNALHSPEDHPLVQHCEIVARAC